MVIRWVCLGLISATIITSSCNRDNHNSPLSYEIYFGNLLYRTSIRGLSVINDTAWWISGSNGTAAYIEFTEGQFAYQSLTGYENKDFRDIHGFNNQEAVILSVGDSAIFLRTTDQWASVDTVYTDNQSGVFIDAMDFYNAQGMAYGDAVNDSVYLVESQDFGNSWNRVDPASLPTPLPGEGGFAASGTNIVLIDDRIFIGTGAGPRPRLLHRTEDTWQVSMVPLQSGSTQGIYSIAFQNINEGIVVGGSFQDSTRRDSVAAYTKDGGRTWHLSEESPFGYRSCVAYSPKFDVYLACGRTGIDISRDQGQTWQNISREGGYYACQFGGDYAILVGRKGKIARIRFLKDS